MYITILDFTNACVYKYKLTDELYEMCSEELFEMLNHDFDNCHFMYHASDVTCVAEVWKTISVNDLSDVCYANRSPLVKPYKQIYIRERKDNTIYDGI
jgi:hypothetical protein